MGKYDKLKTANKIICDETKKDANNFNKIAGEYQRVGGIYANPGIILDDIDRNFSNATQLSGIDIGFVFFATALQCVRQYLFTQFKFRDERPNDRQAADSTPGHTDDHSNRKHRYYNPSLAEILTNPVPFDANNQMEQMQGILKGAGKMGHRLLPGHDPILGWVVGTSNIATSTLTRWDFQSYHVVTAQRIVKNNNTAPADFISTTADTAKIFQHVTQKLLGKEGYIGDFPGANAIQKELTGPIIIASSLIKEAIHLRSDVKSKNSLPFPIVATFSPELANELAIFGVDAANLLTFGKQVSYAAFINFIIAAIHRLLYDESRDGSTSLYEVRTRKILSYSNAIASGSNVLAVAVTEAIAWFTENPSLAKKGLQYFDFGGLLITLNRLIRDSNFIKRIKLEFLQNQWYDIVVGENYDFMEGKNEQ